MNAPTIDFETDAGRLRVLRELRKQSAVTARRMRRWQRLWVTTRDRVAQKNAAALETTLDRRLAAIEELELKLGKQS